MNVVFTFLLNIFAQIIATLFADLIQKLSWKKKVRRFRNNRLTPKK